MQVRARSFLPDDLPGPPRSESYVRLDENLRDFSSDLPLVIIHNFGTGQFPGGGGTTADRSSVVMIFDTRFGRSSLTNLPDTVGRAGINLRGSSTQGYPKSSYAVEFWNDYNQDVERPVLNMAPESDWVLYAPNQFDIPLIHNPLAYELSNDVGPWAPATRMVEVFVNTTGGNLTGPVPGGNYHGIYALEEKIKRDNGRLDIATLEPEHNAPPEITGGYLLKVDRVDANERSFSAGGLSLIYQEPDGLEMVTPQRAAQANYIRTYINNMRGAIDNGTYADWIDEQAFIDHNLIGMFTLNVDAMRLSGYMYKPRDVVDRHGEVIKPGKFVLGPVWDFDRSMGSTRGEEGFGGGRPYSPIAYNGQNPSATSTSGDPGTAYFNANGVFSNPWYTGLFQDLDFWQKYIDRFQELSDGAFSIEHISAVIDRYGAELAEAQPRDQARWGGQGASNITPRNGSISLFGYTHTFDGTYQGELDFLKTWFSDRIAFLNSEFLERPFLSHPGGQVPAGFELDLSGPSGATVYYTLDGTDPRAPGGGVATGAMIASGPVILNQTARVVARSFDPSHNNSTGSAPNGVNNPPLSSHWSGPRTATFVIDIPTVRITEIMYHSSPAGVGSGFLDEDFEYLELKNVGSAAVDLEGYKLKGGIRFAFPNITLAPDEMVVVASYQPAFESRYGTSLRVAGAYVGLLANNGDHVVLEGRLGEVIQDFRFRDDWYPSTDGLGFALVIRDPTGPLANWNEKTGWRFGTLGGTPGRDEPAVLDIPPVYVNEALTANAMPGGDAVELFNPNATSVDVGGWFLSDDFRSPRKFEIPGGTTIAAGGYLLIPEDQFNAAGSLNGFSLASSGEEIFLFSGDGAGNLTGYAHGFGFGPALTGVSFGRHVTSEGVEHFVAQSSNTLGATNAAPKVGPVVISEIMYHPPDLFRNGQYFNNAQDEYIELANITAAPVALFDPGAATNLWKVRDAVNYTFPANTTLNSNERILVVPFDPFTNAPAARAFRASYGLDSSLRLFGPYAGNLGNENDNVELVQPSLAVGTNSVTVEEVIVDKVDYRDTLPWPAVADGAGPALQRLDEHAYGNDPADWTAAPPSPGAGFVPGTLPVITLQPTGRSILAFQSANFTVGVQDPGPLTFQWLFNGHVIPGANASILNLTNVQLDQAGDYQAAVVNPAGSVLSASAHLDVLLASVISRQPQAASAFPGGMASFSVQASSSSPISYQWRKNGVPISGANHASYTISTVTAEDDALYDVLLTDAVGTIMSTAARLVVLINPAPVEFTRTNYVIAGGTLTLSVEAEGTLPMTYRWRRGASPVYEETVNSLSGFYTLTNVPPSENGVRYTVILLNAANPTAGRLAGPMYVVVLDDTDGDGIDDAYETAHGLDMNNGADGLMDSDSDGVVNRDEYTAGTDPQDPDSYLKVENIAVTGGVNLQFRAATGKTYTILYKDLISDSVWKRLADVAAGTSDRMMSVQDMAGSAQRYYRLATPRVE